MVIIQTVPGFIRTLATNLAYGGICLCKDSWSPEDTESVNVTKIKYRAIKLKKVMSVWQYLFFFDAIIMKTLNNSTFLMFVVLYESKC
jgi:hypothetical protein